MAHCSAGNFPVEEYPRADCKTMAAQRTPEQCSLSESRVHRCLEVFVWCKWFEADFQVRFVASRVWSRGDLVFRVFWLAQAPQHDHKGWLSIGRVRLVFNISLTP